MARISTYNNNRPLNLNDFLLGTDTDSGNGTSSWSVEEIMNFLRYNQGVNQTIVSTRIGANEIITGNYSLAFDSRTNSYIDIGKAILVTDPEEDVITITTPNTIGRSGDTLAFGSTFKVISAHSDSITVQVVLRTTSRDGTQAAHTVVVAPGTSKSFTYITSDNWIVNN